MKRSLGFAMMLTLLSALAFASRNSETVNIPAPMKAGSTQLAAGNYDVTWTGTGPNIQVTFTSMQNHKILATVPAQLVVESNKYEGLDTNTQGSIATLESIHMRNMTLVFAVPPSSEK
ncbi:MAG TPA: hypothetical protein VNX17_02030 [Edaphobacter sp.]|jgi:hypothetical protein|nr:hypothetical protein [Edaphobacter sp.]